MTLELADCRFSKSSTVPGILYTALDRKGAFPHPLIYYDRVTKRRINLLDEKVNML